MRPASGSDLRPASHDISRNPMTCALMTIGIAAVFWIGLIWFAQGLYF